MTTVCYVWGIRRTAMSLGLIKKERKEEKDNSDVATGMNYDVASWNKHYKN